MAMHDSLEWLKERRGFTIGIAIGLVAGLIVVGFVISGSSSGTKNTSGGVPKPVAAQTSPTPLGVILPTPSASPSPSPSATSSPPTTSAPSTGATTPVPQPSGGGVSLAGWKLTLPVSKSGDLSGKAKELSAAAVTAPWLVRNADGSLDFWAPATGATTSNSEHSRTELVSDNDFTLGTGVHTLAATLEVTQVPDTDQDIDIGQIHGGGSMSSVPFVMLHWRGDSIVVIVKTELSGSDSQSITLLSGIPLNARFSYTLTDSGDGSLAFTATYDGRTRQSTVQAPAPFMGTDERFQVGDYQQATAGTSPTDGGRVTFYAITTS
jgi:hypothetical protein